MKFNFLHASVAARVILTTTIALLAATPGLSLAAPVVRTASGPVQGIDKGNVQAFLGVPFAAPPVGKLRWRAPGKMAAWRSTRDASRFAPACYQGLAKPWGPYSAEFTAAAPISEDCLYLNVWKPSGAARKLPVLVFIHGGAFAGGSGSVQAYDGANLASKGAVVITINYRVGVFGFLAHPGLSAESPTKTSGNYGLLDQIAALKWVQRNAARFGGDADNVTLSGESAGAASVDDLQVSPRAKGLFHKAVSFSGASMAIDVPKLADSERAGADLAAKLGAEDAAGLRAISADTLIAATQFMPSATGGPPKLRYVPNLDGQVLPADPADPRAGRATRVPLLTGFNAEEMIDPSVRTVADLERSVRARYGTFADRLLKLYPHATDAEAAQANVQIARDRYMSGLILFARNRPVSASDPVYLYRNDHPYPAIPGGISFGAFHSSHLPYVFGNLGLGGRKFGPVDAQVSRNWQDVLLAFMRTGNPALAGQDWPTSHVESQQVMSIGPELAVQYGVSSRDRYVAFREYAAAGGSLGLM